MRNSKNLYDTWALTDKTHYNDNANAVKVQNLNKIQIHHEYMINYTVVSPLYDLPSNPSFGDLIQENQLLFSCFMIVTKIKNGKFAKRVVLVTSLQQVWQQKSFINLILLTCKEFSLLCNAILLLI